MGRSDPNSQEPRSTVNPGSQSHGPTNPGTRYGKGGTHPGQGDNSNDCKVVETSPGV